MVYLIKNERTGTHRTMRLVKENGDLKGYILLYFNKLKEAKKYIKRKELKQTHSISIVTIDYLNEFNNELMEGF